MKRRPSFTPAITPKWIGLAICSVLDHKSGRPDRVRLLALALEKKRPASNNAMLILLGPEGALWYPTVQATF